MAFLRLLIIIPLFSLVLLIDSCSYEEPAPDRTTMIAGQDTYGKTWQINNIQAEFGTVTPFQCVTDNFVTYYPNGRYEINEGATKCDPSDPPAMVGTWEFDRSGDFLILIVDNVEQRWEIESLSSSSLSISTQFAEGYRTYSFHSSN